MKQLPSETRSINLDFDWTYRVFLPSIISKILLFLETVEQKGLRVLHKSLLFFLNKVYHVSGPEGVMTRILTSGTMVLFIAILLLLVLGIISLVEPFFLPILGCNFFILLIFSIDLIELRMCWSRDMGGNRPLSWTKKVF